jgi:hypothetical protein
MQWIFSKPVRISVETDERLSQDNTDYICYTGQEGDRAVTAASWTPVDNIVLFVRWILYCRSETTTSLGYWRIPHTYWINWDRFARTSYFIKNCSSTLYSASNTARDSSAQREEETTTQGTVVWTVTTNALAETNFCSEPLGMGRH